MRAHGRTARSIGIKASATFFSATFVVASAFASSTACSHHVISSTFGPMSGDETKYGVGLEGSPSEPVDVRNDRLVPHDGIILANMRVHAVYIGSAGIDAPPNADPFLTWIGTSDYWEILAQYGVNDATYDGATHLTTAVAFPNAMIENGLIPFAEMDARVRELVHGVDGGAPLLPLADAYAIFLPDNVNIDSGFINGEENITCVTSAAYHAHDGSEAYAVFPPCNDGRSTTSISHELTEIATDPILKDGWMSDQGEDIKTGAEIADVCYRAAPHQADGFDVAELWSNADGDCLPK
ncbi:MAG: hypothetical protein ABI461_01010 [Polyangiaceae bacterium]